MEPAPPPDTPPRLGDIALRDYRPYPRVRLAEHRIERAAVPAIDAHAHLGRWQTEGRWAVADPARLVALMEGHNVTAILNFDGRWGAELDENLDRYDRAFPGRFATFCHVDWAVLGESRPDERLAASLRRSVGEGARGLKVWKDLGLQVRDAAGELVLPDDPRLSALWDEAGALDVPVVIHTADPVAFFDPADQRNERLEELLAHPDWLFADPAFPRFERLIESLEAIVAAHPATTFIGLHVGCYAEDLSFVGRMLDSYPNFHVDIAARIAELGRQPRAARALALRHPDRILFGTDGIPPDSAMYEISFRFLETADECFAYAPEDPPPQGRWTVSGLDLPPEVLEQVYRANCRRLVRGL